MMVPTVVSAINIDGTTITTGITIPKETGECLTREKHSTGLF